MKSASSFRLVLVLISALGLATLSTSLFAKQLRYATGYPPGSVSAMAAETYAERVKEHSNGSLSIRVFALSLLSAAETSDGVRDGLADMGYIVTAYFPRQYPHVNLLNESSMQLASFDQDKLSDGKDVFAFNAALTEAIFFNCPECNQDFLAQNQVYTSNGASSRYALLCSRPVSSLSDLQGARLRVAGSHWSRWATAMGATSMTLTLNEIREALGQGVMDCNVQSAPEILNLGLEDVVTHINMDVPGGLYAGASSASINAGVWKSLSAEQRTALMKAGAEFSANFVWSYVQDEARALEQVVANGAIIQSADEALSQATIEFVEQDMEVLASYYTENFGIQRAPEMLQEFRSTLEKWVGLVQDVETPEALAELYWQEIYSRVDVNTHGLN